MDPITWVAGKLANKLIIFLMAVALVISVPAAGYYGVRWYGVYLFGWALLPGGKYAVAERNTAVANLKLAQENRERLEATVKKQNKSITDLERKEKAATARADAAVARLAKEREELLKRIKGLQGLQFNRTSVGAAVLSIEEVLKAGLK